MRNPSTDTHVAVSRLFIGQNRIEVLPGETICAADCPMGAKDIENYLKGGSIRALTTPVPTAAERAAANAPPPVSGKELNPEATDELTGSTTKVTKPTEADRDAAKRSKFGMDPDGIVGLNLDQLNVMVQERDPSVKPFETVEEAVACLSADYIAPATETSQSASRPA